MSKSRKHHLRAKKEKRIAKTITKHHFVYPKSRGGTNDPRNILLLDWERHQAWHKLFKNMTAEEVLRLLLRTLELKGNQDLAKKYRREYDHFLRRFGSVE